MENEQVKSMIDESIPLPKLEYPLPDVMPANILRVIKTTQHALTQAFLGQRSFFVATATGFQLVKTDQMLYFEYSGTKKQWFIVLTDQNCLMLKRHTKASDILKFSPTLYRISNQHIINLDFLKAIEGRTCKFTIPTADNVELIISRGYFKSLQEIIKMI
jgi:DNA-binding LytR/AlgR family response regulator